MKRIISLAVCVAMVIVTTMSISAATTTTKIDTSKKVQLKMLFIGDAPADQDKVYDEVNKLSEKDLNATFTIKNLSWADYKQQYPLVLASGEKLDIVYSGEWMDYFSLSRKGAFKEITTADLQKYMPQTYKNQPKGTFDQAKVDGKLYMIPQYQNEYQQHRLIAARGDLMDKYGIKSINNIADFEKYCDKVAKSEKGIFPIDLQNDPGDLATVMLFQAQKWIGFGPCNLFAVKYKNGKFDYSNPINVIFSKEYLEFCKKTKTWADKGYWSRNAATGKTMISDAFIAGTSAIDIYHLGGLERDLSTIAEKHPTFKPQVFDITPTPYTRVGKSTNNGVSISVTSDNFDRALMLLEKFKTDIKYNQLSMLGIEGVHYKVGKNNSYQTTDDSPKFPIYGTSMWGWMNEDYRLNLANRNTTIQSLATKWSKSIVYPLTDNFVFNDAKVKSEVAAMNSVLTIYNPILIYGMSKDIGATLLQLKNRLSAAGLAKVTSEFKKQYNEFLKANKSLAN